MSSEEEATNAPGRAWSRRTTKASHAAAHAAAHPAFAHARAAETLGWLLHHWRLAFHDTCLCMESPLD